MSNNPQSCPLCRSSKLQFFYRDTRRDYWRCSLCHLVFVPTAWQLNAEQEKAEYDLHQNDCADLGYRKFLSRVTEPLVERLNRGSEGLDFGCGPGPALAEMLREQGFPVALYDKFYADAPVALQQHYDFITATEVVEHLAQPAEVLERLWYLLRPQGYLALMTKRVRDVEAFAGWHYKNDLTHISFFAEQTLDWLAQRWRAEVCYWAADVVIFRKP